MLPWEHVAVAYICYSVTYSAFRRGSPSIHGVGAVAAGALVPDLIDKPLAWELAVLPGGRSLAHSLLFAVPATLLVWRLAGEVVGGGFATGYLLHLPGDALNPMLFGADPVWSFLLYPVTDAPPAATVGILTRLHQIGDVYALLLASPRGQLYLLLEFGVLWCAAVLWLRDGRPGLPTVGEPPSGEAASGR